MQSEQTLTAKVLNKSVRKCQSIEVQVVDSMSDDSDSLDEMEKDELNRKLTTMKMILSMMTSKGGAARQES